MTFPHADAVATATAYLSSLETATDFKLVSSDKSLTISTKAVPNSTLPVIKAQVKITKQGVSFEDILAAFNLEGLLRKQWDQNLASAEVIETFASNEQLIHVSQKQLNAMVSARDTSVVFKPVKESDGKGRIITTSVVDARIPEMKGFTRAHAFLVGWVFEKTEDGGWDVTLYNHSDPKVSSFLVSKIVAGLPQLAVAFATFINQ
ncbi:UNVERIFIED_CONTAM: hypothetical protein HDU68_003187 [Siphonaria sp. JEL0065]|nr:hypothetical protein HDU68_003187 [Siphonaria sp. JEL0065]